MSAETCVYVLCNKDNSGTPEFRVTVARAVDNIFFEDTEFIRDTFSDGIMFNNYETAITHANRLDEEFQTEYSISLIKKYQDHPFPIRRVS
jgi:hypothetical protein